MVSICVEEVSKVDARGYRSESEDDIIVVVVVNARRWQFCEM